MSTTKKLTGVIYRAYNPVSQKSYIGQTTAHLELRIRSHYTFARKNRTKFANALMSYEIDIWEWSVLKVVPVEELDQYEKFFINDLDTFKNGYNSTNGENWGEKKSIRYSRDVIELYHKDYGVFKGYQFELLQIEPKLHSFLYKLLKEKSLICLGWVLLKNKNKYDEITGVYEFYNLQVGIVKCTAEELDRDYIRPSLPNSDSKRKFASFLVRTKNPNKYCHGWMLLKNKKDFDTKKIVVTHKIHGTYTLFREEFVSKFNLNPTGVTKLIIGFTKNYLGWKLIEEKTDGFSN